MSVFEWIEILIAGISRGFSALAWQYKFGPFLEKDLPEDDIIAPIMPIEPDSAPSKADTVYDVAKNSLGKHITLDQSISAEVGCAEAVSFILEHSGYNVGIKGIPGVNKLIDWMLATGFKEVIEGIPGCVITAHSPQHEIAAFAHTGIVMQHGIASNNSNSGLFTENYSLNGWALYFNTMHNCQTRYFLPC